MKAVLSNRYYVKCDKHVQDNLRARLTFEIPEFIMGSVSYKVVKLYTDVNKDIISIPSGCRHMLPDDLEIKDKTTDHPVRFPAFLPTLRESQQEVYDQVDSSCIVNAQPSWGKTFTGIAIAAKLGQKTLVVTHTVYLREQWEKEIYKVLKIRPSVIGSGRFETDGPITVANIQTLTKRYPEVSGLYGTLILDEAHHCPATTFLKVVDASKARYKIGLTGTLERKDGYHVVLEPIFSPVIYKPPKENMVDPKITVIKSGIPFSDDLSLPWAHRVTEVLEDHEYQGLLIETIATMITKGHKVLVVSDRNDILYYLGEWYPNLQVVVGTTESDIRNDIEYRLRLGDIDGVLGNMTIFKEGISVPPLSCLIIATPVNNDPLLEQLVGRICRIDPGKLTPEVIDIALYGNTASRQATARQGFYLRMGWEMRFMRP